MCSIYYDRPSDHKKWCCETAAIYSDLVPGSLRPTSEADSNLNFGSMADAIGTDMWARLNCEHVVGGATKPNCKGMYLVEVDLKCKSLALTLHINRDALCDLPF